ncbi:MAG: tetratricopeptide repeat protein [Nitrospina sp.]|jgi:protein O-mannosyl-transferase|nr:tetratricopeptide repeat protein [Nitrospina sp.]MBT3875598.1 tetratricopeptide repeat protein [Nitrospina sp.]MBT4047589.1 tetratricopeptide repeat protein [Nitrospina sp.]MBT4556207.1 tetratricopeptide repeat protein [Nitrospina sp.]MBT5348999.1 tetratricopeptide repeat protein [Nitrospina sp.]
MIPSSFLQKLILVTVIGLVYGNTFLNAFHFDDIPSILEKPWIRGIDKVPQFIFSFFERPLVILSFNINYAISEFKVWSYHLFNIIFHIVATLLVFQFVKQALGSLKEFSPQKSIAFFSAMLFALHPLSTQSITYISSRSSVLVTIFYLGALILFFKGFNTWKEKGKKSWNFFLGSGFCFLLGGFSKETIVTLPAMLFLFHFYFISREKPKIWIAIYAKWMFLLAIPLLTFVGYKQFIGGGLLSSSSAHLPPTTWFLTQTAVIPFEYIRKMFFPFNLNIDVDFPILNDWLVPENWLGIVVLGLFMFLWIRISTRSSDSEPFEVERRFIGFGMAWILLTLLPTSSFIPLLDVAVEHRTYLPMVGFAFMFVGGLGYARTWEVFPASSFPKTKLVHFCVVIILLCFSMGVMNRNGDWADEVTLWNDAKMKSPNLVRPYNNLGEAYDKLGKYDEAIIEFKGALKINPNYFFGLNNLGNVYGKQRKLPEAIGYFQRALEQKPDYSPAHYNLARAFHLTGKREEAVESYRKAIKSNPYFEQAFYNLAYLAMQLSQFDEAIINFNKFLAMQPNHSKAHFGLGNGLMMKGQLDLALAEYRKSAELDPKFAFPYLNIANIQMQTKNIPAAIENFEKALNINPSMPAVHLSLGMVYHQYQINRDKALMHLKESLRLNPNQSKAESIQSLIQGLENKQPT